MYCCGHKINTDKLIREPRTYALLNIIMQLLFKVNFLVGVVYVVVVVVRLFAERS